MNLKFVCRQGWVWAVLLAGWGTLTTLAEESAPAVQIIGRGAVSPNYDGQPLTNGVKYSMTAKPAKGFGFTGWSGSLTSAKPKLTFTNESGLEFIATFVDKQKPAITINPVPNSTALVNDSLIAGGTARDNDAVAGVFCRVNGNAWTNASSLNQFSNWWFNVTLAAGANYLEAYAVDVNGLFSKTNKLKLTLTVAPASLTNQIITVSAPGWFTNQIDFGDKTFTADDGVGSYTYKKTGPVNGKISLKFTAPPSAIHSTNDAMFFLTFDNTNSGSANGSATFTLAPDAELAPAGLVSSIIALDYADGISRSVITFPGQPTVVSNIVSGLPNPFALLLDESYPGTNGDRVAVAFAHWQFSDNAGEWITRPNRIFTGSVIETNDNTVTVLFDTPPRNGKDDRFYLAVNEPLNILTCTIKDYEGDTLLTNDTATFAFTNTSPDGALLQLLRGGANQYFVMAFADEDQSGFFHLESYAGTNAPVESEGSFSIALSPQISTQPKSLSVTNGGKATFTVNAKGTAPLTYQWQRGGIDLANGTNSWASIITGATNAQLVITGVATNDVGSYRVVIVNDYGTVTSSSATLGISTNSAPGLTP